MGLFVLDLIFFIVILANLKIIIDENLGNFSNFFALFWCGAGFVGFVDGWCGFDGVTANVGEFIVIGGDDGFINAINKELTLFYCAIV